MNPCLSVPAPGRLERYEMLLPVALAIQFRTYCQRLPVGAFLVLAIRLRHLAHLDLGYRLQCYHLHLKDRQMVFVWYLHSPDMILQSSRKDRRSLNSDTQIVFAVELA